MSVVSDFGVDLDEEILEFGFFEREFVENKIVVKDIVEIGGIIGVMFGVFFNFLFGNGLIFLNLRVELNFVLIKLLIFGNFIL